MNPLSQLYIKINTGLDLVQMIFYETVFCES